jgi:type I restriction enzyme, S subunit
MAGEWRNTVYGDVAADFAESPLRNLCVPEVGIQTGPFGSQLHQEDYVAEGTPIITVEHLGENRILHQGVPRVSDADRDRLSRYSLRVGDIVFSRVGSVDRRALVRAAEDGWLFSGRCLRVRPNPEKIDSTYLSYFFGLPTFKEYIRAIAVGATMPSLNTSILSDVVVPYPADVREQGAIAKILGRLDDKIELAQKMNETLESMARTLFKSWFVDFVPVHAKAASRDTGLAKRLDDLFPNTFTNSALGEIPTGWDCQTLREIADVLSGGTPSKSVASYWEGSIPWISPKSMTSIHVARSDENVTAAAIGNGTRLVKKGSVLVMVRGMGLHQGVRVSQSQCDVAFNQDVKALVPKWGDGTFLLFALLDAVPFLFSKVSAAGHGTGVLATEILEGLVFAVPPLPVREKLTEPLGELNSKIAANSRQLKTLGDLRDTLLPKLISGQLRIAAAQKSVDEVDK